MESFDGTDAVIETLRTRGWSFSDLDQIGAMIALQSAMADDGTLTADSIEKELVNMDLRSIGAKSLPEPTLFRKFTHLHGPKVLQISSARDISRNSIERVSGSSSSRRLLKLGLTDGHSEIVAVEFSHIPSLPDNVVPGTKVRLENKAPVHSGIVCLNSEVITVLGGVVQSLHEEWQMNQKYAGFARSSLKISQEGDIGGPPQFEKLQIGPPSRLFAQQGRNPNNLEPASSSRGGLSSKNTIRNNDFRVTGKHLDSNSKMDHSNNNSDKAPQTQSTEEKPSSSERPKEVAESAPVQNQAAAQKLLQKMNQPNNDRYSRGRRQKGRAWQEEEQQVFTLEEYEKRKAGAQPLVINELPDTRRDEELAWRMQNQFDLEDSHVQRSHPGGEAENIRMNMFSYERDDGRDGGMGYGDRGRGRGRGRGGGGRGRGRGRGGGGGRGRGRSY